MEMFYGLSTYVGGTIRIASLLCVVVILPYISHFFSMAVARRFSRHIGSLVGHIIFYGGVLFIGINLLHEFGFNIAALIGAAGVVGVAIGFASQTSISNIISGFFLLVEHPFSIGDSIKSGDVSGVAESIDLLSVKVRTFDNKLIRIPNETVLKQPLVNLTYYPIRRIDLLVSVDYAQEVDLVIDAMREVVLSDKVFLKNPAVVFLVNKVAPQDYMVNNRLYLSVRVWVTKENFSSASSLLIKNLKNKFDQAEQVVTISQLN